MTFEMLDLQLADFLGVDSSTAGDWPQKEEDWQPTRIYGTFPNWLPRLLDRVRDLAKLGENWDGYGAPRFSAGMITAVEVFLGSLAEGIDIRSRTDPQGVIPEVVPLSSGAIQLEWHADGRILEIEFETTTTIHFLKWWPAVGTKDEGVFPAADGEQSSRLIKWVLRGHESD